MIIILFGLSGAGKNFVGEVLVEHFGYYFWDGDAAVPAKMQRAIQKKLPITQVMRNQMTKKLMEHIVKLQKNDRKLVVAQALYKEENREQILKQFPYAQFIHVQATDQHIHQRLVARGNLDLDYAQTLKKNFEPPLVPHKNIINNDNAENIVLQWQQILKLL